MNEQNRRASRAGGIAGDLFSMLGLVMIAFVLFKLWQEGPAALWVTVSPNRSAYQRRLGYTPLPELPSRNLEFSGNFRSDPIGVPNSLGVSGVPPQRVGDSGTPTTGNSKEPKLAGSLGTSVVTSSESPTCWGCPGSRPNSLGAPALQPIEGSVPTPAGPTLSEPPAILLRGVQPVRISIAKIGIDAPIVEVGAREVEQDGRWIIEWETADSAAGHLAGTAKPGASGNVVLSGHNNIRSQVFRHLDRLIPGDEVELIGENGERFWYVVREAAIVPEVGEPDAVRDENARYLLPTQDERVTLISCWPYWTNTHRVIVVALPVVG